MQSNFLNFDPSLKKPTSFPFFSVTAFFSCFHCYNVSGMVLIYLNTVSFSVSLSEVYMFIFHFFPFPFYCPLTVCLPIICLIYPLPISLTIHLALKTFHVLTQAGFLSLHLLSRVPQASASPGTVLNPLC